MSEEWAVEIGLSALLGAVGGVLVGLAKNANDEQLKMVLGGFSALSFVVAAMNLLIRLLIAAG